MNCENNSNELQLAEEYKYLLSKIRPRIELLDKSKDARLCFLWLTKLDECSQFEKFERNEILLELSRQMKNKCFEPPFNSQPPEGPLKNITLKNTESMKSRRKSLRLSNENKILDPASLKVNEEENTNVKLRMSNVEPVEKLQEMKAKNEELQARVGYLEMVNNTLDRRCEELENEKKFSLSELSRKLSDAENKVRESENYIKMLEKKCEGIFSTCKAEYQADISELEKRYTNELSRLEHILEEKEVEITGLQKKVSTLCLHFEAQVLRLKQDLIQNPDLDKEKRKVKFLKNKLRRIEKRQDAMVVAFQSQLEQIVAKRDLLISILELKLKAKKAEDAGKDTSFSLDNFISEEVCILEAQYRKLLGESESEAAERRQIDLQKILILEKQLVDHGVGVEELNSISYSDNFTLPGLDNKIEPIACKEEDTDK